VANYHLPSLINLGQEMLKKRVVTVGDGARVTVYTVPRNAVFEGSKRIVLSEIKYRYLKGKKE